MHPQTRPMRWIDWQRSPAIDPPWLNNNGSGPPPGPPSAALAAYRQKHITGQPLVWAPIRVPFDDESFDEALPGELVLSGPNWLWSHGDLLEFGHTAETAVYHLLSCERFWTTERTGSHAGRFAQWLLRCGGGPSPLSSSPPFVFPSLSWVLGSFSLGFFAGADSFFPLPQPRHGHGRPP